MPPDVREPSGLNREAVVEAAMELLREGGADALSMRALADRLNVRAASLYWHVRDKEQLLKLVAEALLDRVTLPPTPPGWRERVARACTELAGLLRDERGAAEVLLACLPAVLHSRLARDLTTTLMDAGLEEAAPAAFALLVDIAAVAGIAPQASAAHDSQAMTLALDTGSWRVAVRAGPEDMFEAATSVGGGGAAGIDLQPGGRVVVRARRGGNRGAVLLNPRYTWHVKVHGGTWSNELDLSGLRVSGIQLDSGAGNLVCILPLPVGVVPVEVNSGLVGVTFHRPPEAAVHALVHTGSVKVRFDGTLLRPAATDVEWESSAAARSRNRYELTVHSGCVKVSMDASARSVPVPRAPDTGSPDQPPPTPVTDIVEIILDGIEHRLA